MKSTYRYITLLLLVVAFLSACKKMDSTYKQFIVVGGIPYTGKATSPKAYAGHNRVKIQWLKGADPNVTSAIIFWNNYADSLKVTVPETADTISVIIDNLPEKTYTFQIKTYDSKGVPSIPVEILSGSYGDKYQSQLINRPVNAALVNNNGDINVTWGNADISNGAVFTETRYINISGNTVIKRFAINQASTLLPGVKPGTGFQYRTVFKPDTLSIDEFFTGFADGGQLSFDKKSWSIIAFSTQHPGGDNTVTNFIDGTDATRWHTLYGGSTYPHFATIDMGAQHTIAQFSLWRTTFANGGDDRGPDKVKFLVSNNNIDWTDLGIFNFNRFINGEQKYAIVSKPNARYFKFIGLAGPQDFMVMGEVSASGY